MAKPKRKLGGRALYRGDQATSVALPSPAANRALVSHILYEGGMGRETQWTSTTETEKTAEYFARAHGRVWKTDSSVAIAQGALHLSRKELLQLLKGYGKGQAKWNDAIEVASARAYVLMWDEHLLNWRGHADIKSAITATFR